MVAEGVDIPDARSADLVQGAGGAGQRARPVKEVPE